MFTDLKALAIPEGAVKKIEANGVVLWEEPSSYTNQLLVAIDTNGSLFNGKGYVDNTRLSSSGSTKTQEYVIASGYISASSEGVVRIFGTAWVGITSSYNYVCTYDSNFKFIGAVNSNNYYGGATVTGDSEQAIITLPENSNIAYVRVSIYHKEVDVSKLIVTVNEEIA